MPRQPKRGPEIRIAELEKDSRSILMLTFTPEPPDALRADLAHATAVIGDWRGRRNGAGCDQVLFNVVIKQPHHDEARRVLNLTCAAETDLGRALEGLKVEVVLQDLGANVRSTYALGVGPARPWWKLF